MRPIEVLYRLQQVESRLEAIERDLASLDTGEKLEAEANRLTEELAKDKETLRKLRQELLDQELELNDMEAKMRKMEDLLASGSVRSGREVEHMQKELNEFRRRKDILENRMLDLMLQIDETERKLKEREELLEQTKEQLAQIRQQAAMLKEILIKERLMLLEEREKLRATLPPELLARYERLKARLGGVAVAKIEGNLCGACRVTITAETIRALRDPEGLPTCENCGRFLFGEV
ncbi:MAG: C4-type zinc ribbon domain-containing protein [Armatimonadetes bacterium]|nr:C4-type zinc ribbon domain-containing protein [Armatimonadota bacterium]MDW8027700.1 C4-type zinc ribbon domain-containing protein [Armatimonadota bacterium]